VTPISDFNVTILLEGDVAYLKSSILQTKLLQDAIENHMQAIEWYQSSIYDPG